MNRRFVFWGLLCFVVAFSVSFVGCFETETTKYIQDTGDVDQNDSSETAVLYGCQSNLDCSYGKTCFNGECRTYCVSASTCSNGEICRNDICAPVGASVTSCSQTGQCLNGLICINGWCRTYCDVEQDCATGEVCRDHLCTTPIPCQGDSQCPVGQDCYQNRCYTTCTVDNQCLSEDSCTSGVCLPESEADGDLDDDFGETDGAEWPEIDQDDTETPEDVYCEAICNGRCGSLGGCDCGGCQDGEVCNGNYCVPDVDCIVDEDCGEKTCDAWSRCQDFVTQCSPYGTRYRDCNDPFCADHECYYQNSYEESDSCYRDPSGLSCDAGWGEGSGTCDEDGYCIADSDGDTEDDCPAVEIIGPETAEIGGAVTLQVDVGEEDAVAIENIRWSFTELPTDASNFIVLQDIQGTPIENVMGTAMTVSYVPVLSGVYKTKIEIFWADSDCPYSEVEHTLGVGLNDPLQLVILWQNSSNDFDIHLVQGDGSVSHGSESATWDCHWSNCTTAHDPLDWGQSGTGGNPLLIRDDVQGFGPEAIKVQEPIWDGQYIFAVEWYSGTSSSHRVEAWVYSYGERLLHSVGDQFPGANYHWNVAGILVSEGVPYVVSANDYAATGE